MRDIAECGIGLKYITTDPDGFSYKAASDLCQNGILNTPPEHQLDNLHVSNNHRNFISNTNFSDRFFGTKTAKQRSKLKSRLSTDVAER